MLEQVRRTIEEYHMAKGGRLIVGLSGGADSVCLLHVLRQLVPRYGWDLQAVHIHHGLPGRRSRPVTRLLPWGLPNPLGCLVRWFLLMWRQKPESRAEAPKKWAEFCGMNLCEAGRRKWADRRCSSCQRSGGNFAHASLQRYGASWFNRHGSCAREHHPPTAFLQP